MNSQFQNKILTLIVVALAMTSMVGCSSQSSNSSPGSTATTTSGNTTSSSNFNSSGQALTNCSHDIANISDLSMGLEVYSSGGVQNMNSIRVRFNAFPAAFVNAGSTIAFWAYGTDSSGSYTTMTEVPFTLEHYTGTGSFTSISSSMYTLTWQQLASIATTNGVSNSSAAVTLQNITFVIDLSSVSTSTVLSAALYTNGMGTSAAPASPDRYLQALIPSFLANPNNYILTHNSTLLGLHPFYANRNSGYTETQFSTLGSNLCF